MKVVPDNLIKSNRLIQGLEYNNESFRARNNNGQDSINANEFGMHEQEPAFNYNSNTLCLFYQNNKLACAFYNFSKKCLFYLNDLPENSNFELTELIIADVKPLNIITSAKNDVKFIEFLKKKCGPRHKGGLSARVSDTEGNSTENNDTVLYFIYFNESNDRLSLNNRSNFFYTEFIGHFLNS